MLLKRYKKLVQRIEQAELKKKHKKAKKIKNILIHKLFPQYFGYEYYCYKPINKEWSEIDNSEIIYIPKHGYDNDFFPTDVYTKCDLLELCFNSESFAETLWEDLEWSFPETLLEEKMQCYESEEELIAYMNKFGADLGLVKREGYLN